MFQDAEWKNPDDRKLDEFYKFVGRPCTTEFIEEQAKNGDYDWQRIRDKLVWKAYRGYFEYARLQADLKDFPRVEEWSDLFFELYASFMTVEEAPKALTFSSELLEKIKKEHWKSDVRKTMPVQYAKNATSFVEGIIYPLTRRAYKTKSSLETIKRILDLSLAFFEDNETKPATSRRSTHDLLNLTLLVWTTAPETFDTYLRKFLGLYYLGAGVGAIGYGPLLLRAPMSFLDPDLEKSGIVIILSVYCHFATGSNSSPILSVPGLDRPNVNPDLWQIYLLHRIGKQMEADELALKCFTDRKAKATAGSTQQIRAQRAREAVYYTIASGSPAVYRKSLEWILQRFIRDFSVVSAIFENYTDGAKALVVGIPKSLEG
ncbi:uncharacterized protein DFL_006471 [Arthrobotrys flagrans]|uniref:Uncharacterized protein n=1 Tax=Arthrobotrys flagrans TaxID=97331 RepID=A0A437A139_ARTFL|nr:hypothetical protein DFL_006471 [Arthrobotrys flagrans]